MPWERYSLVVDIGAGTCAVSRHRAGGIGYERAVFRSSHHGTIDRYLIVDTVGDGLSLSSHGGLNLSQQVTTFAGAFLLLQLVNALG